MRKKLLALILTLSGCAPFQTRCPDDEEILGAGLNMYKALKLANSDDKIIKAKLMYDESKINYFKCKENEHLQKHSMEAIIRAFNNQDVPYSERLQLLNNKRILEYRDFYPRRECR